jgi:2-iminobutanoate/2-iminopropanoate deaminase
MAIPPSSTRRPAFRVASLAVAAALLTACATPRTTVEYFHTPGSKLPFSPAVRVGDVVYLSGQIGLGTDGRIPVGIEAQSRAAMDNVAAAAKLAGVGMDDVFKCTVMLDDMSLWGDFNRVYVGYFKPDRLPARSAFGADGLALGAPLEVECLAVAPRGRR